MQKKIIALFRRMNISNGSIIILFLSLTFWNCNGSENKQSINHDLQTSGTNLIPLFKAGLDNNNPNLRLGDTAIITYQFPDTLKVDSIVIESQRFSMSVPVTSEKKHSIPTQYIGVGAHECSVFLFYNQTKTVQNLLIRVLPGNKPETYGYKIVKAYPHDKGAFTQGLIYEDGYFLEATGLMGESSLRKVKLESGVVVQSFAVSSEIFGEGIAIFENKIALLSWQNRVGFVYEKGTFKLLHKFEYATEGWGLTFDGKNLIMSDGTSYLYFLDTSTYTVVRKLEVLDYDGTVKMLNELEYIEGQVFANVYMTDKIVKINPETGEALAYIDLSGLLPDKERSRETDVLNGIAYDKIGKRLFVTGKKWPKLYEISLQKK